MENHVFEGATILFDLDGTLIDTAPDLLRALNTVLAENQAVPVEEQHIRSIVGRGAKFMLTSALNRQDRTPDDEELETMFTRFIEVYESDVFVDSRIFDQVPETLEHYRSAGASLVVCTNKLQRLSEAVLSRSGLDIYFDDVFGADRVSARKPAPDHLLEAIAAVKQDPERAIMIGDSATDLNAAKAGNIPCLLFEHGYTDVPVQEMESHGTFGHYDQLTDLVVSLLKRG